MKTIVSVSGGLGSAETLKRCIDTYGRENVIAMFADVKGRGDGHYWTIPTVDALLHERFGGESRDTYRFLWQLSYALDIPIIRLEDGRSIWRVMADNKAIRLFSGGRFVHKCSSELKREAIAMWIVSTQTIGDYQIALGMKWDEQHRVKASQTYWRSRLGWGVNVIAPNGFANNADTIAWLKRLGVDIPASYTEGFEHNNCNGGCIAAGQGHFARLYRERPNIYAYWQYQETQLARYIGSPVTILKYQKGGDVFPISLADFVGRIETDQCDMQEVGGCGCFTQMEL